MTYEDKASYDSTPPCMINSTKNATPPTSTKAKNSNFLVQIQINHDLNLNLYRKKLMNLSFSIWWILGV